MWPIALGLIGLVTWELAEETLSTKQTHGQVRRYTSGSMSVSLLAAGVDSFRTAGLAQNHKQAYSWIMAWQQLNKFLFHTIYFSSYLLPLAQLFLGHVAAINFKMRLFLYEITSLQIIVYHHNLKGIHTFFGIGGCTLSLHSWLECKQMHISNTATVHKMICCLFYIVYNKKTHFVYLKISSVEIIYHFTMNICLVLWHSDEAAQ